MKKLLIVVLLISAIGSTQSTPKPIELHEKIGDVNVIIHIV